MRNLITLMTDFGDSEGYAGVMKGVMSCINPKAQFIDIAHDVPAHDVFHGAFVLGTAYAFFPAGTVHLAVVDPGVGSFRRPVAVSAGDHFFVGPDNGVFTFVLEESEFEAREIAEEKYTLGGVRTTFDGRDVFAPVASYLSLGVAISEFGPRIDEPVMLSIPEPESHDDSIEGHVLHIDRFGNIVTNIRMDRFRDVLVPGRCSVRIGASTTDRVLGAYSEGHPGEPFCIWGSHGYLEMAVNGGRASELTGGVVRGGEVVVRFRS
jgi:S-adenosylmethionine hydrolase